jgi:hypothetical protein
VGVAGGETRPARRGQPVLGIVAVGEAAVAREVAVAVIARAHRAHRGVLVEAVGGVAHVRRRGRIVPPAVVARALADAPVAGVVAEGKARTGGRGRRLDRRRIPVHAERPVSWFNSTGNFLHFDLYGRPVVKPCDVTNIWFAA